MTTAREYGTYSPKGSVCDRCKQEVKPLERVQRGFITGRDPGVLANVVYTHLGRKCPQVEPSDRKAAKK